MKVVEGIVIKYADEMEKETGNLRQLLKTTETDMEQSSGSEKY